jgi:hypothetical protein
VKIYKREAIVWNNIAFVFLSYLFLYVVESIGDQKSAYSLSIFYNFFEANKVTMVSGAITVASIFFIKRISKIFMSIFFLLVLIQTVKTSLPQIDKYLLFLVFCYLCFALTFIIMWGQELKRAYYLSNISLSSLNFTPKINIPVTLVSIPENTEYEGYLTNWDSNGCFIRLSSKPRRLGRNAILQIKFGGRDFETKGSIITSKDSSLGIGVRIKDDSSKNCVFNWNKFYTTLSDLGYHPKMII